MKKFNINEYMYIQINESGWKHLKNTVGEEYVQHCIKGREFFYENTPWYRLQCHQVIELFEPHHISTNVMFDSEAIEEILVKPRYNQSLIDKVHNREAVIEVDDFTIIKDLINFMYPNDPYLEDIFTPHRYIYYTYLVDGDNKYWGSFPEYLENKTRIKASEFLL